MAAKVILDKVDKQDLNGTWVMSYKNKDDGFWHRTRSGYLWNSIENRCKSGGLHQRENPGYVGSENLFKDYQSFAYWCQEEYGYFKTNEGTGKFWSLDKDILIFDNKHYSEDTCMFVPIRINNLILSSKAIRGLWPQGVYKPKGRKRDIWVAGVNINGDRQYLGEFSCPFEAHRAWQMAKIKIVETVLEEDKDIREHYKLKSALGNLIERLHSDYLSGKLTN